MMTADADDDVRRTARHVLLLLDDVRLPESVQHTKQVLAEALGSGRREQLEQVFRRKYVFRHRHADGRMFLYVRPCPVTTREAQAITTEEDHEPVDPELSDLRVLTLDRAYREWTSDVRVLRRSRPAPGDEVVCALKHTDTHYKAWLLPDRALAREKPGHPFILLFGPCFVICCLLSLARMLFLS